jgi:hypothetical protein
LSSYLHRLISGETTNDEFDDAYYQRWHDSKDSAVAEISGFGYGLYSSDLILPYRLKGRYAVPDNSREIAQRALLFLETDLEYERPVNCKGVLPYWCLWGPGCYLFLGLILLLVAFAQGGFQGVFFGGVGLAAVSWTFHWLLSRGSRAKDWDQYSESGDFQVWPFLRRCDFDKAERTKGYEETHMGDG